MVMAQAAAAVAVARRAREGAPSYAEVTLRVVLQLALALALRLRAVDWRMAAVDNVLALDTYCGRCTSRRSASHTLPQSLGCVGSLEFLGGVGGIQPGKKNVLKRNMSKQTVKQNYKQQRPDTEQHNRQNTHLARA